MPTKGEIRGADVDLWVKQVGAVLGVKLTCDEDLLNEVAERYNRDRRVLKSALRIRGEIDENRQGAFLGYWIARLKPIVKSRPVKKWINEVVAAALSLSRAMSGRKAVVSKELFLDLVYALRNRILPKESFSLMLKTIRGSTNSTSAT